MPPRNPSPKPDRLTREDWLRRALDAVAREGRGRMSIDEIVAAVGVTKGSFYWHFKNREEFVDSLLDFWVEDNTARVPRLIQSLGGSPEERLLALAQAIINHDWAKHDVAIHAWALREERVAKAVTRAEGIRFKLVRSLFAEMGFEGDDLEMRVRTFVVFRSFEAGLRRQNSKAARLRQAELRVEMLTRQ